MPRCGVSPVVLSVSFRSFGSLSIITRTMSTRSLRVVGSPPGDAGVLDVLPQRRAEDLLDLLERHVLLAVAARPVAAHVAAGVADERHVEDQDRRVQRRDPANVAVDEVAGSTESGFGEVLGRVDLRHKYLSLLPIVVPGQRSDHIHTGCRWRHCATRCRARAVRAAPGARRLWASPQVQPGPGQVAEEARQDDQRRQRERQLVGHAERAQQPHHHALRQAEAADRDRAAAASAGRSA